MKLRVDTPVLLNAANDLVFQAIDWQGGDEPETLKPGDVWPVDWKKKKEEMEEELDPEMEPNDEDDERQEELHRQMGQRIHMIRIFGITAEGHSVCIHIRDYHPFVYVKPPRGMVWGDRETKNFADWLDKSLRNWVDGFSGKTKDKHGDLLQIELEHRKDFIGFREEKPEPFLKLTFKNSATCKAVARFLDEKAPRLRNGDIPFEVFEANIEPMIRLIHQQDLAPVGWIRIPAGKFKILQRSQKWSICQIEAETTNVELYPVDSSSIGPMLIASFDLECTSGDGSFPKPERLSDAIIQIGTTVFKYAERTPSAQYIFTLGDCAPIDNVIVVSCRTERDLLKEWAKFMRKLDADVVTGYNIWGFDWVYYKKRCEVLKITEECFQLGRLIGRPSIWTEKTLSSSALGDNFLKFFDLTGRIQIDMLKVVQNGMEKLDMYKLDFVANHYLKMNKVDLSPKELFQRYRAGTPDDIKEIAVYCVQDCALVNQLINKLEIITNNAGMGNVCYVPLSWLFLRGQGVKIFSLVSRQCRKEGFCMPWIRRGVYWRRRNYPQVSEESSYEGAIVLVATPGIYLDPIFVMDYNSLYPSSMIAENISHDSVVWFRIIDLEGNMVYQWGDESYDNLPNYNYWNIEFDNFVGEGDKKQKSGKTIVRYAENKNGVKNVVPRILQGLLKARKDTRKQMEIQVVKTNKKTFEGWYAENGDIVEITGVDGSKTKLSKTEIIEKKDKYNSFQQKVLDGLQLAYKVTANSLYGQVGAATSPICMKELAASTTATGRQQLKIARNFVEREYPGAVAVYGDTDSVFINAVPHLNKIHNREIRGQEALELSIELGQKVAKRISAECLKKPQNLAYEKTLYPFIQLAKKRYVGNLYEEDPHKFKLKYMGIVLKRRDNANIVKKIYGGMISSLLNDQDLDKAIAFFQDQVENLLNGNVDLKELVITKTLKGSYKNRDQIAHAVLADRMGLRDPGNKPAANDRIPYIYIETQSTNNKILQGDKIEHPDYIKARLDEIRPDYRYYYEHQVKVPCIQLLALALEKLPGYQDGWWERWVEWMDEQKLEGKRREHKTSELRERETERLLCSIFIRDDDAKRKMRNDEKQLREGVSRTVGQLSMARFVSQTPINTQNAEKKLEILKKRVEQEQEEQNRKSQSKLKIAGKTIDEFWKKR